MQAKGAESGRWPFGRRVVMNRVQLLVFCLAGLLAVAGCRSQQLRRDQDQFRHALLDMETNQIFDNLIRARCGLPIVHMDYDRISGTVTQSGTGDLRGSYTDVVGGSVTRALTGGLLAKQDNQLGVTGSPVRDKPEVYVAYLQYLTLDDGLIFSVEPPPPGAAHLCRCCEGGHYWVPSHRAGDFFQLSMRVTGLRDNVLQAPSYFEITIRGVVSVLPPIPEGNEPPALGTQHEIVVELEKPLPMNDSGSATAVLAGRVIPLSFLPGPGAIGEPTTQLRIAYTYGPNLDDGEIPVPPRVFIDDLAGLQLKFYSSRFRPEPPKRDKLLEQIRDELNAIRLETIRRPAM